VTKIVREFSFDDGADKAWTLQEQEQIVRAINYTIDFKVIVDCDGKADYDFKVPSKSDTRWVATDIISSKTRTEFYGTKP
jgi:hypothetical protein